MFDFLRNLGRSEEELKQDALNAYLDGSLTPAERERFEQHLARDDELQEQLVEMQFWRQQMRALPARRVPRNFTLDPAVYGRPQRQPLARAYPILRTATALAAFMFVIALATNVYLGGFVTQMTPQAEPIALMQPAAVEETPAEESAKIEMEMAVEAEAETTITEDQPAMEQAAAAEEIVEEPAAVEEAAVIEEAGAAESAAAPAAAEAADANAPLPPGLLSMQATSEPPSAAGGGGEPPMEPATVPADELPADAAPAPETALPTERNVVPSAAPTAAELPEVVDESIPQSTTLLPGGFTPLLIALGILFVILLVLTLVARPRW